MQFHFKQKVLFKHCDPAGIVFYPRYFEMMNDCVEAFFDHIGLPFEEMHRLHGGVPTAEIKASFEAPSRHGDHLDLHLELTRIGTTSAGTRITTSCDGALRMQFTSTLVQIDTTGTPRPWSAETRAALTPYLRSES